MAKKVLMIASNYGLWGEELQAPWDIMKKAGFELTLATRTGKTPLPMAFSIDPEFVDPLQGYAVNPPEVCNRIKEIIDVTKEWDNPIKIEDAKMADYDAIALVGGPGSPLDVTGNPAVHSLILDAYKSGKIIGALCYVVGAVAFTRDPDNGLKSIMYGKKSAAHPLEWDFFGPLPYPLYGATEENKGTDLVTPGFVYRLQPIIMDAVGYNGGQVFSDPKARRENPVVVYDHPFVTAQSAESSIAYGEKLVEVLA